jgi:hypothetical protein
MGKDGYIMVKVAEWPSVPQSKDNWKFKHVLAWEQANGRELPEAHVVMFADHDKRNFDPGNLVAVPRKYIVRLNSPDMPDYHDRDTLLACGVQEVVHVALVFKILAVADGFGEPCDCVVVLGGVVAVKALHLPVIIVIQGTVSRASLVGVCLDFVKAADSLVYGIVVGGAEKVAKYIEKTHLFILLPAFLFRFGLFLGLFHFFG